MLVNEERRGRVERNGDRWRIVPGAFPPEVLQAIGLLDDAGSWSELHLPADPGIGTRVAA